MLRTRELSDGGGRQGAGGIEAVHAGEPGVSAVCEGVAEGFDEFEGGGEAEEGEGRGGGGEGDRKDQGVEVIEEEVSTSR